MELVVVVVPILAAVIWYSLFAQIPFSRFIHRSTAFEILATLDNSERKAIFVRGSISRFEYWKLKRTHDRKVLAQLGISSFDQANGMLAEPLNAGSKLDIRRKC